MTPLSPLIHKAPIVSTYTSQALHIQAADVQESYQWHANTYVEQTPLAELRRRFITSIQEAQTPKACLVAPFGYGKTASAIGVWEACQQANLLAVPPASYNSFAELARALYDWLAFVLPSEAERLKDAHDQFLARSATTLARRDERHFGIPFEQGLAAIQDKLERGYLDFESVTVNLIAFINQVTTLAQEMGYGGLVLIIDEFQQLLGNANKGVLVALRHLIWGLRTRQIPFGLLITMDPDTERTLSDRAGDILHRIKDDGMYLDIRQIYEHDFPTRLWQQYRNALNWPDEAYKAIDQFALRALGQLCERDDLSNGPRTVINVLQSVAIRAESGQPPYSPIDLIDDLLSGTIRFDGDRGIIPALVGEFLNYPYFQNSPSRTLALKLMAAFPRGCSREVAQQYGVEDAWLEIGDDLRGDIISELEGGLALIELQGVGRKVSRLNLILRQYWMQMSDSQLQAEGAMSLFAEIVLPFIFPAKSNDLKGWEFVRDVQLSVQGSYTGVIEGTSSPSYPLRRIAISVVQDNVVPDPFSPGILHDQDYDFHLIFRLDLNAQESSDLRRLQNRDSPCNTFEFKLAIRKPRSKQDQWRGVLAWIEHFLSPQPISPALVLNLLHYLKHSATGTSSESLSERDQTRLNNAISRLQEWLIAELFPPELFMQASYMVLAAGDEAFKEFLYFASRQRWPNYKALIGYQNWSSLFDSYLGALKQVSPRARMGTDLVIGSKREIAQLFGHQRHAGFESRAKQYGSFLNIEEWSGRQASLRFSPHPLEEQIALEVRQAGTRPKIEIYQQLRHIGFASAESNLLLDLATTRGLIMEENEAFVAPNLPTVAELSARARQLHARYDSLANIDDEVREELERIINPAEPLLERHRINWQLDDYEQRITEAETQAEAQRLEEQKIARDKLLKLVRSLSSPLSPVASHDLTAHLRAIHQKFTDEQQKLKEQAKQLLDSDTLRAQDVENLMSKITAWNKKRALFERWNQLAQRVAFFQDAISEDPNVDTLIKKARAILSQKGIPAMGEISRLELSLADLERKYQASERKKVAHPNLVQILSELPKPTDLTTVLHQVNGAMPATDILTELLRLQKEGHIRLTIEMLKDKNR